MAIEAVVFDMGGVLVELGPITEIAGDDPVTPDVFWDRWLTSPAVRDFEMGRCSVDDFGERLLAELRLGGSGAELVERFRAWPRGLYPRAQNLVESLRGRLTVAVLSNTNALHWTAQQDHLIVEALFDRQYLSYELGMAKPDADIFEHVIADLNIAPESILFLDDNQANVDAARAAGIDGALAKGVEEARRVLVDRELLSWSD